MIDALSQVNWLAILAASIAQFVLGGIWFVGLVAKPYRIALGISGSPAQKPGALLLIGPFVCSIISIATSAVLLRALGITSYGDALLLGTMVGLGYLTTMTLTIAINPLFPRPFLYTVLNAPYFIVSSLMACVILLALS